MGKLMRFLCSAVFCIAVALGMPQMARAADVEISEMNFPDQIFRNYVANEFDKDKNGKLSDNEITRVISINVDEKGIKSLKGIEYFTTLRSLECGSNQLTELDISKNIALNELQCDFNQLTELDISKNTALHSLDCGVNQLTELDVSKNTKLINLECSSNQLSELDVSKNTVLVALYCGNNQLSTLDVSKNTALDGLLCSGNQLSTLDVSKNIVLTFLGCDNNQLSALDVSKNITLIYLRCHTNQLITLDVSKNTALTRLECYANQLTTLDISKNTALTRLECSSNQLTILDISKNTVLTYLNCGNNQLLTLDVSKNMALQSLACYSNQLTTLDVSKNIALTTLSCHGNLLTELKLNKRAYYSLPLETGQLHGSHWQGNIGQFHISNLSNVTEKDGIIKVTDITKPGTYQYSSSYDGTTLINFTIIYVDTENNDLVIPYCNKLFNDYEYKNLVSGTAITIYGNGSISTVGNTKVSNKEFVAYTDILASYNYSVNKGKVKASIGKVIVGITMSDTKPTITKNKIVDNEAAKIAKAKIKNGQITVTATGKAGGVVYLWIMDTGNKGVSECCPINVKLAPKKLEVQETTGNKASKLKIANGDSKEVKIAGFVGTTKTEDCTYTVTVDSKSQNYILVTTLDDKSFTLKGTGLKNNKDTKVSITFTCKENGKKIKFTATIIKSTM